MFVCTTATSAGKEKADFLAEIDMMKKIAEGYNAHIVNMVGCVTLQEPLCLITEFIPYGDLLSYLKHQRKKVKRSECISVSKYLASYFVHFDFVYACLLFQSCCH